MPGAKGPKLEVSKGGRELVTSPACDKPAWVRMYEHTHTLTLMVASLVLRR